MKAFIDESFWSDPLVEELAAGEKLAILWLLTNSKRDLCGFTEISHKRFKFDTGLEVTVLQRALQGLGKGFVVPSKGFIWSKNFIAHQLGRGVKLQRNNITKSVVKHLVTLPIEFQELLLSEYPELEELTKGLPSPYQGERKGKGKVRKGKGEEESPKKFQPPTEEEFIAYLVESLPTINDEWTKDRATKAAKSRFETYVDAGWKDGHRKPISNWKIKSRNAIKCEKPWSYGGEGAIKPPKPVKEPSEGPTGWQKGFRDLIPQGSIPIRWDFVDKPLQDEIIENMKTAAI